MLTASRMPRTTARATTAAHRHSAAIDAINLNVLNALDNCLFGVAEGFQGKLMILGLKNLLATRIKNILLLASGMQIG